MAIELWDVLDENGNATGRFHERGKPMNNGEYHLEVSVWIENDNGEYLISQRSPNKTFPNMWECTGGNAVAGDDSLTTALKEAKEELGITLDPRNGRIIKHHLPCSTVGCQGLIDVWLFRQNIDISTVILDPDETCDAMWANRKKIKQMIDDGSFISVWYPYLDDLFLYCDTHDIPGYNTFIKIEPIEKGWSEDKKYYVETVDGQRMLLRISDVSELDRKKAEYGMMERVYELGIITPQPFGFGLCGGGKSVYSLSAWLDGEDAEKALPLMSETEQYDLGLKAGETLRKIHTLPAPKSTPEWDVRFFGVMDDRLDAFQNSGISLENDRVVLDYLRDNRYLLKGRPQCFRHGDYSIGNLMITNSNEIAVIDWETDDFDNYGDPWLDFTDVIWSADKSPHFATGVVKGYFGNEPSVEFWERLMFYVFTAILSSIQWVAKTHKEAVENEIRLCEEALHWFGNMKIPVPTWYLKDFYIQWTDGVPYKLKAPFDFSFLNKYGKAFKVYDDQDSGNICFGMKDDDNKYFVKFAGAPTERACVSIDEAVANLKRTVPVYKDLVHPNLIKLIDAEETGGGFAMVFEWVDAECMHPMYPMSRREFLIMTLETRYQVFEDILTFHAHTAKQGYVAIDFYDGSIMYDFNNNRTVICDIDFYTKAPYINNMGRLWGSSRFMSPEEFQLGATIDEITNVYAMGATAFALFGNERDRCIEKWKLSKELFDVAKRAVSDERDERQQTLRQLIEEWRTAKI